MSDGGSWFAAKDKDVGITERFNVLTSAAEKKNFKKGTLMTPLMHSLTPLMHVLTFVRCSSTSFDFIK